MKKIFIAVILCCLMQDAGAQFFRGVGIFIGPNSTAHRYRNLGAPLKDPNVYDPDLYYPQNHYSHDYFSFGTGILLEFLRYDHVRWQTEIEYTNKGAIETDIIDPYLGTRGGTGANVYQYIQWNNYLKYFGPEGDRGQWYVMFGAKIEYKMSSATPIFPSISGTFPLLWVSGDVALGYEFFTWKRIHPIVEFHFNPDLMYQPPRGYTSVRSRTFELRVGLIYRPKKSSIDDCNAPKYHGNYY
jgi:hypothetical protein